MTVNISKYEFISVGTHKKANLSTAFGKDKPNKKCVKCLGIHLDKNSAYSTHAKYISQNLTSYAGSCARSDTATKGDRFLLMRMWNPLLDMVF